jgi:hypothetical protein
MHTVLALLSVAVASLLIWLVIRIIDTGIADLSIALPITRADEPTAFWALTVGLVVVIVLLLLLAAVLLVEGPVTRIVQ